MKRTIANSFLFLFLIMIITAFSSVDENGIIHLKITKEENGSIQVFEKQYESMEELKADRELTEFDALAEDWVGDYANGIVVTKAEKSDRKLIRISEDGNKNVSIQKEIAGELNTIQIKTADGEENFTMKIDTDGDHKKISIDESGKKNKTVSKNKTSDDTGIKQTMDVNIEEKNGEKFIEIKIKRAEKANVTIYEILQDDTSLLNANLPLKNNLKLSQLNYYPNPSTGRFTLRFSSGQKEETIISIMDISGKQVYREKLPDFQGTYDNIIDLSGKDNGIYILQINQKNKTLNRKILIE